MTSRTNLMRPVFPVPRVFFVPGLLAGLATLAGGCIEREGRPVNPCTQVNVAQAIQVSNVDRVDLLLMVDNSNSMAEEQASLAAQFPLMIGILASGDFNQDGDLEDDVDFDPVQDLNVGVITSDMGTAGFNVPTCGEGTRGFEFGDDGILRTAGNTADVRCMTTYPTVLNFQPDSGVDPMDFATDVACVATLGTGGCGFEQQLEAILKALTPDSPQPWTAPGFVLPGSANAEGGLEEPFYMSEPGNGNNENNGFLRENAVLAIIPVTDEEDCSAHDAQLFNPNGGPFGGTDLNLRCFQYPQAQHDVSRYVDGLVQLRERPGLLIYAPITGIPVDLAPAAGQAPNYPALIGNPETERDPRMVQRVDPETPTRLAPSCNVPGRGVAFPPVRIVQVAQGLQARGANVTVQSICQASFENALLEVIRQITSALGAACLPRPLNIEANGEVNCDVLAVLGDPAGNCESFGAVQKTDEDGSPLVENGNPVCVINQLVPTNEDRTARNAPDGTGWYYDDYTEEAETVCLEAGDPTYRRIAFAGTQPPSGSTVRLECFLAVEGGGEGVSRSTFCDPAAGGDAVCEAGQTPSPDDDPSEVLVCDPVRRACDVACVTDADCRSAGLVGFVCDKRPLSEVDPDEFEGNDTIHDICVNPTCG